MNIRKPIVAGNWKMNNTINEARHLVSELVTGLNGIDEVEKVICPSFPALLSVSAQLEGTDIGIGAQNMYWEESGAYTGEVSPIMLAEICQYVILGHSERRGYFGETNTQVNKKVKAALGFGLTPIVCVGETLEENEAERTAEVVKTQVQKGLEGLNLDGEPQFVIAYEPVWAIGTGRAATPEGANAVIAEFIRKSVADKLSDEIADSVRVLYGGSVKAKNAADFFDQPDIDGALVGGASLVTSEFVSIVQAAKV
jgi:triosephosphate isomerase